MARNVGRPYKINKKELVFLIAGVSSGLGGGVIGNFMVSSFFLIFNPQSLQNQDLIPLLWIIFITSALAFSGLSLWLLKKLKELTK